METGKPVSDVADVLAQYLDLFKNGCAQFKYYMAPETLIDWFGRTIYGSDRVYDLMRFHVHAQYEHINFDEAKDCDAIEEKPVHMKTKQKSSREVSPISSLNKVTGISSLKSRAESDDDTDTDSDPYPDPAIRPACGSTSEKAQKSAALGIDGILCSFSSSEDSSDGEEVDARNAKRLKRSPSTDSDGETIKKTELQKVLTLLDDSSDEEEAKASKAVARTPTFSELRYFEANGRLRARSVAGHQSHGKPDMWSHFKYKDAGDVRIRISYRRELGDNTIQYALIIYEHLEERASDSRLSRRNLMTDFAAATATSAGGDSPNPDEEAAARDAASVKTVAAENDPTDFSPKSPPPEAQEDDNSFFGDSLSSIPYRMRTPDKRGPIPPPTPKRKANTHPNSSSKYGAAPQSHSASKAMAKISAARNLRL